MTLDSQNKKWVYANEETPHYDLVVSLGTDHHPYDRAVEWVDAYLKKHPEVTCFFQHGFTSDSRYATENAHILPRAEMLKLYEKSSVAIVHGGPGCILDVRAAGRMPLTMPRRPWLGEHVDEHQVRFTKVMDEQGEAILVHDQEDFERKLDAAIGNPAVYAADYRVSGADEASDKLEAALQPILREKSFHPVRFVRRWGQVIDGVIKERRSKDS